ncbi:MAG: hypothetical protein KFF73_16930 [Cyclobacteriaceae bacterium]|nr:hypothetical protein [Cyclobacteriaceae bacterium]
MTYTKATFAPLAGDCYGHGWKMLWKNFLVLFLIGLIIILFSFPISGFTLLAGEDFLYNNVPLFILPVFLYGLLVLAPMSWGVYYAFLKAVRGEKVEIKDMFIFTRNYGSVLFAYLLMNFIIGIGMVMLIIPGIIFACKLAFVPFLVIDKNMNAMDALKTSWSMTDGYAMNIFLIGVLAIFISIGGIIVFFVGIIIATMWIYTAIASMYYAVDSRINPPAETEIIVEQP